MLKDISDQYEDHAVLNQSVNSAMSYLFIGIVILLGIGFHIYGALRAVRLQYSGDSRSPLEVDRSHLVPDDRC